jgi:single stranded DNA-binding protein
MSITITVTGRLTSAPVLRRTRTGKQVATFSLAHNFRAREGDTFIDVAAVFFRCTVWEDDGGIEVAGLGLTKGSQLTVEGSWSKRAWSGPTGERRVNDELRVTKVRLLAEAEITGKTVDDGIESEDSPAPDDQEAAA